MNYLLDTNVLCEPAKPKPNERVLEWLAVADEDRIFLSTITLAEIQRGVSRLPQGARRERTRSWLEHEVMERFENRIFPVDNAVGLVWGRLMADAESSGRTMNSMDGFIAATAMARDLTLVTRNIPDFRGLVPHLLNPWESS